MRDGRGVGEGVNIWDADAFRLSPVAEAIGPFCTHGFLEVVSAHDSGEPLPVVSDDAFLALRRVGGEICFAGDADVTDYHTPFGEGAEDLIARFAHESLGGSRLVLDSLPEEAAKPLVDRKSTRLNSSHVKISYA